MKVAVYIGEEDQGFELGAACRAKNFDPETPWNWVALLRYSGEPKLFTPGSRSRTRAAGNGLCTC
jgi:hypothetical protein